MRARLNTSRFVRRVPLWARPTKPWRRRRRGALRCSGPLTVRPLSRPTTRSRWWLPDPAWLGGQAAHSQRELNYGPGEPALLAVGEVRMVEEEMNPYVLT